MTSIPAAGQPRHTNHLAAETSPYLLQHAHNPVDWHPWGKEAFEKARREGKPIFLSVGYSSCHWCHVMERESFELEDVGRLLNAHFVCIKVDREERPDIDDIYMAYVQMTTQHGGWPMSVLLTPQAAPFFGFTYFPKERFLQVMGLWAEQWKAHRTEIERHALETAAVLREHSAARYKDPERPLGAGTIPRAVEMIERFADLEEGGMQGRMKFPPHNALELLTQILEDDPRQAQASRLARLTLDRMQLGGIHDHVGGGFHRYATDPHWLLPHFEKMLYDNAQLAGSYARAAAALREPAYARTARGILEWVLREMSSKEGVFYSAYDADSEGEEGRFYVWDRKEVEQILGADAALFCQLYQIRPAGNFHEEATGQATGLNILHLERSLEAQAPGLGRTPEELRTFSGDCLKRLLAIRQQRVWPGLDDKILTGWNALMISGFARAGRYLHEPRYRDVAVTAAEWLLARMRDSRGRWLRTHNRGRSKLPACLDDHAALAVAFLDLYQVTAQRRWLGEAEALVERLNTSFWDEEGGGYFFTPHDHEELLVRLKNPGDGALPSGNALAAQALVRLAEYTGKAAHTARAQRLFQAFHTLLDLAPIQVEALVVALRLYLKHGGSFDGQAAVEAQAKVEREAMSAELFLGREGLPAGGVVPVALRIAVREGWHLQAGGAGGGAAGAFSFRLVTPGLGRLELSPLPVPERLEVDPGLGLGREIRVYGGTKTFYGSMQVAPEAKVGEEVRLEVECSYQACSDAFCQAPQTIRLGLRTRVLPAGSTVRGQHAEIFPSE